MPQKKAGEATGKAASGSVFSAISKLRSGDDVTLTKVRTMPLLSAGFQHHWAQTAQVCTPTVLALCMFVLACVQDELLGLLFIVKLGGALVTGLAAGALPLQGYAGFAA